MPKCHVASWYLFSKLMWQTVSNDPISSHDDINKDLYLLIKKGILFITFIDDGTDVIIRQSWHITAHPVEWIRSIHIFKLPTPLLKTYFHPNGTPKHDPPARTIIDATLSFSGPRNAKRDFLSYLLSIPLIIISLLYIKPILRAHFGPLEESLPKRAGQVTSCGWSMPTCLWMKVVLVDENMTSSHPPPEGAARDQISTNEGAGGLAVTKIIEFNLLIKTTWAY